MHKVNYTNYFIMGSYNTIKKMKSFWRALVNFPMFHARYIPTSNKALKRMQRAIMHPGQ